MYNLYLFRCVFILRAAKIYWNVKIEDWRNPSLSVETRSVIMDLFIISNTHKEKKTQQLLQLYHNNVSHIKTESPCLTGTIVQRDFCFKVSFHQPHPPHPHTNTLLLRALKVWVSEPVGSSPRLLSRPSGAGRAAHRSRAASDGFLGPGLRLLQSLPSESLSCETDCKDGCRCHHGYSPTEAL